ncbi:MAG: formylglycine-generating enzyme family protein [Alphaproteobacteria bacterium]
MNPAIYNNHKGDLTELGSYPPNTYGFYDMAGNVKEWCHDVLESDSEYKLFKGGSWGSEAYELSCAYTSWLLPQNTNHDFGFRCVRGV